MNNFNLTHVVIPWLYMKFLKRCLLVLCGLYFQFAATSYVPGLAEIVINDFTDKFYNGGVNYAINDNMELITLMSKFHT